MTELLLFFRPRRLRLANRQAAVNLYSAALTLGSDLLLIDLPEGMEPFLSWPQLSSASTILEAAVEAGVLPASSSMLRSLEPLVEGVMKAKRQLDVEVRCYADPSLMKDDHALSMEVPRLLLRASLSSFLERDLKEWLDLVERRRMLAHRHLQSSVGKVASLALKAKRPICLAGLEAWELAKQLREVGFKVQLRSAGLPYLHTPLEVLEKLHSRGLLTQGLLEELVKEQLSYVKEYVMKHEGVDEAHATWTLSKAPWLLCFKAKLYPGSGSSPPKCTD